MKNILKKWATVAVVRAARTVAQSATAAVLGDVNRVMVASATVW